MTKKIMPNEVASRLQRGEQVHVIDVREAGEVALGKIPGAIHIPLAQLALRKNELDASLTYVVTCQSGNRSKAACGLLTALGYQVEDMVGGMKQWQGELV
ncbi:MULTISPECIES: rhodanese-like domain-containing protein [unclassified Virgibacillus]|uniref:rhodanese-like domain-containing protein n=1 Tax=unclassified Virgibacillus TaxID=2620237 RepID=UPI0024DEA740|nr:rhodanese-like domain-containing protein [Virgibacillus sp. LDC-1]